MTTLADFLLARIAEEHAAERDEYVFRDIPADEREALRPRWSKTLGYQAHDLSAAGAALRWALVAAVHPAAARSRAARYADHPDYREEWRP